MNFKEMQKQLNQYALIVKNKDKELKELKDKLDAASSPNGIKKIAHSADFWAKLRNNCANKTGPFGTYAIKSMIKNGTVTIYDTDQSNHDWTLLHISAVCGAYDLAQFLINNVCYFCILIIYTHISKR